MTFLMNSPLPRKVSSPAHFHLFNPTCSCPHFHSSLDPCLLFPATYVSQAPPLCFGFSYWEALVADGGQRRGEDRGEVMSPTPTLSPEASPPVVLSSSLDALALGSNNLPLPCMSPALGQGAGPCNCSSLGFLSFPV